MQYNHGQSGKKSVEELDGAEIFAPDADEEAGTEVPDADIDWRIRNVMMDGVQAYITGFFVGITSVFTEYTICGA